MKKTDMPIDPVEETKIEEVIASKKVAQPLSNKALTQQKLDSEPKVTFLVPLAEGEDAGATDMVSINGCRYDVPKGQMIELPLSVMKILAEKYKINAEVGRALQVDRNSKVLEALS